MTTSLCPDPLCFGTKEVLHQATNKWKAQHFIRKEKDVFVGLES